MRTQTQEELINIIRFEICGRPFPQGFAVSDEEALTELAKKHDLAHLVFDALTKNGLSCNSQSAMQQYFAAIWRAEQMDHELAGITGLFEEEGIDFIPLKGSVLRPLYPEPWMRTSADIDILVRPEDLPRATELVVEKLGYNYDPDQEKTNHIGVSAPGSDVQVELHHELFWEHYLGKTIRSIVNNIWDGKNPASNTPYCEKKPGFAHWYLMSDGMFYLYHIAHMAKHIKLAGGCTVRSLMDLWILDGLGSREERDRQELLRQGSLTQFGKQMSALASAWMNDEEAPYGELEQYIMTGSLSGNNNRRTANLLHDDSVSDYVWKRVFLPYNILKNAYPVIEKHKWLTPVFQVVRWTKVFNRKYREKLKTQADALVHIDDEQLRRSQEILNILDIEDI